jgi:ABC-2 type transport system permease protein
VVFGGVCLVVYGLLLHIGIVQILLLLLMIACATVVFFSVTLSIYAVSFLFMDASTVTNGLFELFLTPALFHGGAFHGAVRIVFTFIIPSLLVGTLPVEILRDIRIEQLLLLCVLSVVWLFISLKLFSSGVKKYESTNLMTFGN